MWNNPNMPCCARSVCIKNCFLLLMWPLLLYCSMSTTFLYSMLCDSDWLFVSMSLLVRKVAVEEYVCVRMCMYSHVCVSISW